MVAGGDVLEGGLRRKAECGVDPAEWEKGRR